MTSSTGLRCSKSSDMLPGGNLYQLPLSVEVIDRLDMPDSLRTLLALTFKAPGIYEIDGRVHVVGDPDVDAEASVFWHEDRDTACVLPVWPGRIEFRRRARTRIEGEAAQVETLAFRSLSPDGRELADFALAADL